VLMLAERAADLIQAAPARTRPAARSAARLAA
jgi:hypothetical protein